ncbi:MAG: hypothetical protein ACYCTH_04610 [Cellulomonas sp.]
MNEDTAESIAASPLPTSRTLRLRRNVPFQLLRFAAINLRMAGVILRGHK